MSVIRQLYAIWYIAIVVRNSHCVYRHIRDAGTPLSIDSDKFLTNGVGTAGLIYLSLTDQCVVPQSARLTIVRSTSICSTPIGVSRIICTAVGVLGIHYTPRAYWSYTFEFLRVPRSGLPLSSRFPNIMCQVSTFFRCFSIHICPCFGFMLVLFFTSLGNEFPACFLAMLPVVRYLRARLCSIRWSMRINLSMYVEIKFSWFQVCQAATWIYDYYYCNCFT